MILLHHGTGLAKNLGNCTGRSYRLPSGRLADNLYCVRLYGESVISASALSGRKGGAGDPEKFILIYWTGLSCCMRNTQILKVFSQSLHRPDVTLVGGSFRDVQKQRHIAGA